MTLAFVTPSFYPAYVYGGPTVANYALCKTLAAQGAHISVVTTDANGKTGLQVEKNRPVTLSPGLSVTYFREQLRNRFSRRFIQGARLAIRDADAVHIQSVFSVYTVLALRFAKKYGKPVLLSPNGSLGLWSMRQGSRFKKAFVRLFIEPYLSGVVFHASSAREAEEIKALLPEAVCTVIANGVDLDAFNSNEKPARAAYLERFARNTGIRNAEVAVALCRLHKVKGLDILIRSVHMLRQNGRNVVLLIAGPDSGEKENLQRLTSELALQDAVFFTGELGGADKTAFLGGADVFALPSFHENFGIAYLEALAAGIPVVASRQTPWQEVETAGCGRWVDNTPEDFAEAIHSLLETGNAAVADKARAFASRFSWDNMARQFMEAYRGGIPVPKTTTKTI